LSVSRNVLPTQVGGARVVPGGVPTPIKYIDKKRACVGSVREMT